MTKSSWFLSVAGCGVAIFLSHGAPRVLAQGGGTFPGEEDIRGLQNQGNGFCHSSLLLDVDGDGVQDYVFGEVFDDGEFNSVLNAGAVLVIQGQPDGNPGTRQTLAEIWNPDETSVGSFNSGFGLTLAGFQAEGQPSLLLVGAPFADHPSTGAVDVGAVYLFQGPGLTHIATRYGDAPFDRFGAAAAEIGDLTGDQVPEFAVGSPRHDAVWQNSGRITVLNGQPQSGSLPTLFTVDGEAPGDLLGSSVIGHGRFSPSSNGMDIACGAPGVSGLGEVWLVDTASRTIAQKLTGTVPGRFGTTILFASDHNSDGNDELLVGDPTSGRVSLHSTMSGSTPLWVLTGNGAASAQLGASLSLMSDLTGDGLPEFAVGAPSFSTAEAAGRGAVGVFAPAIGSSSPALLWGKLGSAPGDSFGSSLSSGPIADDQDGTLEGLVVCAPIADGRNIVDSGVATAFGFTSGGSASLPDRIDRFFGTYSGVSSFGPSVTFRRRRNVVDDWVVSSRRPDQPGPRPGAPQEPTGRVFILSGSRQTPGKVLRTFDGRAPGDGFGSDIVTMPAEPFNGNDRYLVVGASRAEFQGVRSGVIQIFDISTGEMTFEFAPSDRQEGDDFGATLARLGTIFGLSQGGQTTNEQIAIGAPGASEGSARDVGKVYVYTVTDEGTLDLSSEKILVNDDPQRKAGDRYGAALAGPLDQAYPESQDMRTHAALIVGAPYADRTIGGDTFVDAGRVFVYGLNRIRSNFQNALVIDNSSFDEGDPSGDLFGFSVAGAWDLNPGGGLEFVVGSPLAECGQRQSVGRVTVYTYVHSFPAGSFLVGICALPQAVSCPRAAEGALFGWSLHQYRTPDDIASGFMIGAPGMTSSITGARVGRVFLFDNVPADPPCLLWELLPRPDELSPELGNDPLFGSSLAWSANRNALPGEDLLLEGRILIGAPFQDFVDAAGHRSNRPRTLQDLGKVYMLPLALGRPRE